MRASATGTSSIQAPGATGVPWACPWRCPSGALWRRARPASWGVLEAPRPLGCFSSVVFWVACLLFLRTLRGRCLILFTASLDEPFPGSEVACLENAEQFCPRGSERTSLCPGGTARSPSPSPVSRWLRSSEGSTREQPRTPSSEDRDTTTYVSSKNLELKQDKLNSSAVLGPNFMAILFRIS